MNIRATFSKIMKYAGDFNEIQFMALFYQNTMEIFWKDMVEFYQNIRGILANIRRTKRWNITIKENNVALDYLSIFSVRQPTPAASRAVNTSIRSSNLPYMAFLYMTRTSIILYNLCGKFIRKKQKLY